MQAIIKEAIEAINTALAAISFAFFARGWWSVVQRSTVVSMAVLTSSNAITTKLQINNAIHSSIEMDKRIPAAMTRIKHPSMIFRLRPERIALISPLKAYLNDCISISCLIYHTRLLFCKQRRFSH